MRWAEQQYVKHRVKRDLIEKREEEVAYQGVRYDDVYWLQQWYLVGVVGTNRGLMLNDIVIVIIIKNQTPIRS